MPRFTLVLAGALALSAAASPHGGAPCAAAAPTRDGAWQALPSMGSGTMIHDPLRDRMLILRAGNPVSVWEVPLAGPLEYRELMVQGVAPGNAFSPVYDSARDRILFLSRFPFGDPPAALVDVLELSPVPRWGLLETTGDDPGDPNGHAAVYDPVRDELLLFGGNNYGGTWPPASPEVFRLDLATDVWSKAPRAGGPEPLPRMSAVGVYDSRRHRFVLHGGYAFAGSYLYQNDLWAFDVASDTVRWIPLQLDGPDALGYSEHAGVYDALRDRLIVYGGRESTQVTVAPRPHSDVRAYSFQTGAWETLAPPGGVPGSRYGPHMGWDPVRDRLLMGCGQLADYSGDDTGLWELPLGGPPAWRQAIAGDPVVPPRAGYASAWDTRRGRALVWGGRSTYYAHRDYYTTYIPDLDALSFGARPIWASLQPTGTGPSVRQFATLCYDGANDAAWLFGGSLFYPVMRLGRPADLKPTAFYGDVWRLDLAGSPAWTEVVPDGAGPAPRDLHAMVCDSVGRRLLLYGGRDAQGAALGDLWALSLDPPHAWTRLEPAGLVPGPRFHPALVIDPARRRLVLSGGSTAAGTSLADSWELPLEGPLEWRVIPAAGEPPATLGPRAAAWDTPRDRLLVFGRGAPDTASTILEVRALEFSAAPSWSPLAPDGRAPWDRAGGGALYDPDHDQVVLLWGALWPVLQPVISDATRLMFAADAPTPARIALVDAGVGPGAVTLLWHAAGGGSANGTVERRAEGEAWQIMPRLFADGGGLMRFEDRDVVPGARYAYRLSWSDGTTGGTTAEHWVLIPTAAFALEAPRPNPASGGFDLSFSLPAAGPARVQLIDVGGRVVADLDLGPRRAGPQQARVEASGLAPGLYLVRLTRGEASLVRRLVLVR